MILCLYVFCGNIACVFFVCITVGVAVLWRARMIPCHTRTATNLCSTDGDVFSDGSDQMRQRIR